MYYTKEEIAQMTNEILIHGQMEQRRREDEAQRIKEKQAGCNHLRLRCTNNVYFCQDCGQRVALHASGVTDNKQEGQEKKPAEASKRAVKRKTNKSK